jgi:hypothetical protein
MDKIMDLAKEFETMLEASKCTRWDYGPELFMKVVDMLNLSKNDTHQESFYTQPDLFRLQEIVVQALGFLTNQEFKSCIHKGKQMVRTLGVHASANVFWWPSAVHLYQVDAQEPFWKPSVVDFKQIREGFQGWNLGGAWVNDVQDG